MELKLVIPQKEHENIVMDFQKEFLKVNERISGGAGLEQAQHYEDWLKHKCIPHYGQVEEAVFLFFDHDCLIGISDIRLEKNEMSLLKHMQDRLAIVSALHKEEKGMLQKYSV